MKNSEKLRLRIKDSQNEALSKHHNERLTQLLKAFRAGVAKRPLQVRNGNKLTDAYYFAHKAGLEKACGNFKTALAWWRHARFFQGLNSKQFVNFK